MALVVSATASAGVLWGLSWQGAEDAVVGSLSSNLVAEARLVGEHLREVPVDVLVELGEGHASKAVDGELSRMTTASGLHDAALLGPDGTVLGSDGGWLPGDADRALIERARSGTPAAGALYRAADGELYLSAYAPLPERPGWVVAVEGSATLGAVDQLAHRQALASVVLLLLVAVLGGGLAVWIARPLRQLEDNLVAVRPGDPPDVVVVSGPREVVRVAQAAQELLSAIRERDDAVAAGHRREVEQLTRLAAEIAHEVRNPLNAMSLSIDRLARLEDADRRAVVAGRVRTQLDELEAIVSRLVDLTRPLAPSHADVDLVQLAKRAAEESDVDVDVTGVDVAELRTDPTLVVEVVRNLLLNAAQAGAQRITVTVAPDGLRVEDDGPGVDDADVDRVFEWFHTTRAQGSGLGLPASRRIARALGGDLVLASARPATFHLALPGEAP